MTDDGSYLRRQFKTAWSAHGYCISPDLDTEECLWRPAAQGMHVHRAPDGTWRADWPEHERYDLGPSSIGAGSRGTWDSGGRWCSTIPSGRRKLTREAVTWPVLRTACVNALGATARRVDRSGATELDDGDLRSTQRTRWPFGDRPFGDVVAWVNVELTKNAAEIGYARFLYAVRR